MTLSNSLSPCRSEAIRLGDPCPLEDDIKDVDDHTGAAEEGRDPEGPAVPASLVSDRDSNHACDEADRTREGVFEAEGKGETTGTKPMVYELSHKKYQY